MQRRSVIPLVYVIIVGVLLCFPALTSQKVATASSGEGKQVGIYISASQAWYPYPYSPASSFVGQYASTGLFSTILIYAQCGTPCSESSGDFAWTLQLASAFDSVPNFKMVVDIGFDIGSSSDWSTVQAFVSDLAAHSSVGWVGIEGEHTTYTGCEFGGSCPSIGEAWSTGALSESQLESYYSEFDGIVASAGLQVAHYYLTFGDQAWVSTQQAIYVSQWPACGGTADVQDCNDVIPQDSEILGGTSSNYVGISAGLSTNCCDYWNPTVSGLSSTDAVISTYIQAAEQQPASSRQLIFFETGAYGYVGDQWRPIFTTDLANAMAQYSDFIYAGSAPQSTTSSSALTTSSLTSPTTSTTSTTLTTYTTSYSTTNTSTVSADHTNYNYYRYFIGRFQIR